MKKKVVKKKNNENSTRIPSEHHRYNKWLSFSHAKKLSEVDQPSLNMSRSSSKQMFL